MKRQNRELTTGIGLMGGFIVVLVLMFLPLIKGKNMINHLDDLYNTISKGSVYYIPGLLEEAESYGGKVLSVNLRIADESGATGVALLAGRAGLKTDLSGTEVKVTGSLGDLLTASLEDADALFHNRAERLVQKYGINEREVLYNWWLGLTALEKELTRQKRFQDAKLVSTVLKKAVECSYNYYRIEAVNISEQVMLVILSLIFYVIYTVWFGFSIMYILAGLGFQLEH